MDTLPDPGSNTPTAPLLLRINEAARLLSISRAMVYTIISRGDIATVKYGGNTRIPAAEISRWIAAYTVPRAAAKDDHDHAA